MQLYRPAETIGTALWAIWGVGCVGACSSARRSAKAPRDGGSAVRRRKERRSIRSGRDERTTGEEAAVVVRRTSSDDNAVCEHGGCVSELRVGMGGGGCDVRTYLRGIANANGFIDDGTASITTTASATTALPTTSATNASPTASAATASPNALANTAAIHPHPRRRRGLEEVGPPGPQMR